VLLGFASPLGGGGLWRGALRRSTACVLEALWGGGGGLGVLSHRASPQHGIFGSASSLSNPDRRWQVADFSISARQ
jgi:hypothetical protein